MVRLLAVCASGTASGAETLLHMGISGVIRDILVGASSLSRPAEQVQRTTFALMRNKHMEALDV